jgi:hypothetical protein
MSFEFMDRAQESGWDKFTEIGLHAFDVIQKATSLRGDQKVFILAHEETEKSGIKTRRKIKTIGKMLDDKINLEGLFTIVVFTEIRPQEEDIQERYKFSTQTDSESTAKAPMGMFDEKYIPNDLQFMAEKINDFYGIE